MFRAVACRLGSAVSTGLRTNIQKTCGVTAVRHSHGHTETDAEFDARQEAFFKNPDIDGWDLRRALNDLQGYDLIPEPKIIISALQACRRLNDYAVAVRYLEGLQVKCGAKKDIWPYILQEIKPTLLELGISTPEEMGYDKPEMAVQNVYDIH